MITVSIDNGRLNIVDDNDVALGFEVGCTYCDELLISVLRDCEVIFNLNCYKIDYEDCLRLMNIINGHSFDPSYYVPSTGDESKYEGNKMTFKIVADGLTDLFVSIESIYNGCHGHDFDFCKGATVIVKGVL
jgi:hypothetical protein